MLRALGFEAKMFSTGKDSLEAVGVLYKRFTEHDTANGIRTALETKEDDSRR